VRDVALDRRRIAIQRIAIAAAAGHPHFVPITVANDRAAARELERSRRAIGVVDDQFVAGSGSTSGKPLQRKPAPHAEYGAGDLADTVRTEAELVAAARAELACPFAPAP